MLPPEFDFIHNKDVAPFQMMVIPFGEDLNKQDLIDIYQGVMPTCALYTKNDRSKATANCTFTPQFGGLYISDFPGLGRYGMTNFLSPSMIQNFEDLNDVVGNVLNYENEESDASIIPFKTSREFYRNLRFMVFKVKQRAKKDYENYKNSQIFKAAQKKLLSLQGDNTIDTDSIEAKKMLYKTPADIYGANWPYDYFSLIESGKLDIEIEVGD